MKNKNSSKSKKKLTRSCMDCTAVCCRNLAVQIYKPETKAEVEDLKWQVHFDTVQVYIKNRRWFQLVEGTCSYLSKDNRCSIYQQRPDRCRKHKIRDCEKDDKFYDIMLSTPEQLEDYFRRQAENKKKPN